MKSLSQFTRTTLMGEVLSLLPIVLVVIFIQQALEMVAPVRTLAARHA